MVGDELTYLGSRSMGGCLTRSFGHRRRFKSSLSVACLPSHLSQVVDPELPPEFRPGKNTICDMIWKRMGEKHNVYTCIYTYIVVAHKGSQAPELTKEGK
jgi:hypothetical protein